MLSKRAKIGRGRMVTRATAHGPPWPAVLLPPPQRSGLGPGAGGAPRPAAAGARFPPSCCCSQTPARILAARLPQLVLERAPRLPRERGQAEGWAGARRRGRWRRWGGSSPPSSIGRRGRCKPLVWQSANPHVVLYLLRFDVPRYSGAFRFLDWFLRLKLDRETLASCPWFIRFANVISLLGQRTLVVYLFVCNCFAVVTS